MYCSKYRALRARFELAQRRYAQFSSAENKDLISLYTERAANIQREEKANMALLIQNILDHRAACTACTSEATDAKVIVAAIQAAVAERFGLSVAELKSKDATRAVAVPRQIAMYLAKLLTHASLQEIGKDFGGKHHTTVAQSIARVHGQRGTDSQLASLLVKLLDAVSRASR